MNKTVLWIIIGVVVLVGSLLLLKSKGVIGKDEGIKVSIENAATRTIIETVTASGKIYPEVEVKVSPDISGEIVELNVNEGDTVKRGQVVARIYADIYASQKEQQDAMVSQSQAQLANVNANLSGLKATLDQTKANYDRQKKLLNDKVISAAEFETAQQSYLTAQASYNAALANIKSNEASIKSAQAQLQRADKDLSRTTITSPMDGVISLLSVKKGERVAGNSFNVGTEMMRVADLGSFEAQVDVGENDIPKVKIGDTALIEVDAYSNRKFKGLVYKIANANSSSTTASSSTDVTNYTVHIRLLVDSYKDLIKKGSFPFRPKMSASADIQTRTVNNTVSIPLNAVATRDKKGEAKGGASTTPKKDETKDAPKSVSSNDGIDEVVFVYDSVKTTVKQVKVKTGIQDLNYIQITEGLKAGEAVVTGPYNVVSKTLKEGDKVKKTDKDKLFDMSKKD
jgi:HlyD family secretion protein